MSNEAGQSFAIWLARAAVVLYVAAIVAMRGSRWRLARGLWTAGLAVFLAHVLFAFAYFYEWSHTVALRETARQTRELFGVDWGGGLYLNYAFAGIWFADCLWQWLDPRGYLGRSRVLGAVVHAFLAFMMINASVVVRVIRGLRGN